MQYVPRYNPSPALCELGTINSLYARARSRAHWGQLRSALTRRSDRLLNLAEIDAIGPLGSCHYDGMQTVPICHIQGSHGRAYDFDADFNPLRDHNKGRWLSVAGARQRGKPLPPVDLVQVGGIYFVQDGHHRISVARALGQQAIEAKVTVWKVTGALPWETPKRAPSHRRTVQPTGAERVLGWLRRGGARFVERTAPRVRQLAVTVRTALRGSLVLRPSFPLRSR